MTFNTRYAALHVLSAPISLAPTALTRASFARDSLLEYAMSSARSASRRPSCPLLGVWGPSFAALRRRQAASRGLGGLGRRARATLHALHVLFERSRRDGIRDDLEALLLILRHALEVRRFACNMGRQEDKEFRL
jgi:hypothetical protein